MSTFLYPTDAEMIQVAQEKTANLTAARPIFNILPIREVDDFYLIWEQLDDWVGLQGVRGLNGSPGRVKKTGGKSFFMAPGVYGEWESIDESEITQRRSYGAVGQVMDIETEVMSLQDKLLLRRLDRIEQIGWTLLTTGTFSVSTANGVVAHTDTFTLQTYDATNWNTYASSTPLLDFKAVSILGRGKGVSFGMGAVAYMNQKTFNNLTLNANASDLARRFSSTAATLNSSADITTMLRNEGLPDIVVYDEGYKNDAGTFTLFIPDDKVVVIGKRRTGQIVGEYRMTRNANNPDAAPGAYQKVVDKEDEVPRCIKVHDGHNGGPVLFYPGSVCVMSTGA